MLVLTPTAVAAVNTLTVDQAGLRISADTTPLEGGLQVEIAPGPAEDDQVITESGARIFLDPQAVPYLDDKVLDADVDDEGRVTFKLGSQSSNGDAPQT